MNQILGSVLRGFSKLGTQYKIVRKDTKMEQLYKFYLAGFYSTTDLETAVEAGWGSPNVELTEDEQEQEAFSLGVDHASRNPMPPNLPVSFNVFSGFFPTGGLRDYARV